MSQQYCDHIKNYIDKTERMKQTKPTAPPVKNYLTKHAGIDRKALDSELILIVIISFILVIGLLIFLLIHG